METTPNIFADFDATESRLDSNQDKPKPLFTVDDPTPRALHNQRQPLYTLKAERPEHRAIIMMKASAMTNKEIAAAIGWTAQSVMYVVKQPWAVDQILREIENAGREPVLQLLKVSAMEAAEAVIGVMRGAESDKVRLDAAKEILDRNFGKATQKMEISNKAPSEFSDAELAAIAAQGKRN